MRALLALCSAVLTLALPAAATAADTLQARVLASLENRPIPVPLVINSNDDIVKLIANGYVPSHGWTTFKGEGLAFGEPPLGIPLFVENPSLVLYAPRNRNLSDADLTTQTPHFPYDLAGVAYFTEYRGTTPMSIDGIEQRPTEATPHLPPMLDGLTPAGSWFRHSAGCHLNNGQFVSFSDDLPAAVPGDIEGALRAAAGGADCLEIGLNSTWKSSVPFEQLEMNTPGSCVLDRNLSPPFPELPRPVMPGSTVPMVSARPLPWPDYLIPRPLDPGPAPDPTVQLCVFGLPCIPNPGPAPAQTNPECPAGICVYDPGPAPAQTNPICPAGICVYAAGPEPVQSDYNICLGTLCSPDYIKFGILWLAWSIQYGLYNTAYGLVYTAWGVADVAYLAAYQIVYDAWKLSSDAYNATYVTLSGIWQIAHDAYGPLLGTWRQGLQDAALVRCQVVGGNIEALNAPTFWHPAVWDTHVWFNTDGSSFSSLLDLRDIPNGLVGPHDAFLPADGSLHVFDATANNDLAGVIASCVGTPGSPVTLTPAAGSCGVTLDGVSYSAGGLCKAAWAGSPTSCTFDGAAFETLSPGAHSIAIVATAPTGSTTSCISYVTVTNAAPPQVACPANTTVECSSNGGTASFKPTVTDLCSAAPDATCSAATGSTFAFGSTPVSCSTTDAAGGTGGCGFNVNVTDTLAPVVSCPPSVTAECVNLGSVQSFAATAIDRCVGAVTPSCTNPSGSTFGLGTTIDTCSATDPSLNTGSCAFSVKVQDTLPPVVTCPLNQTVECINHGGASTFTASASDLCVGALGAGCTLPSGTIFPLGVTADTCLATDPTGNIGSCAFAVKVQDTLPPVVTCPANQTLECVKNGATPTFISSAADQCAGTLTPSCAKASGTVFPVGVTADTCTATDPSGNSSGCGFSVKVQDTIPPVVTCPSNPVAECTNNGGTPVFTASAIDQCVGALNPSCAKPSGTTFPLGVTPDSCQASDPAGNTGTCGFKVMVKDTLAPVVTCPANQVLECVNESATATFTSSALDQCVGKLTSSCARPSGSSFALGSSSDSCSASDPTGNTGTCSFGVKVVDTYPPVVTCPPNQIVECTNHGGTATFSSSAYDVCAGALTSTCALASGTNFPYGMTPDNCMATDPSGNAGSCGFNVTVEDTIPPSFVLAAQPTPIVRVDGHVKNGGCDDCAVVTLAQCIASMTDQCDGKLDPNRAGWLTGVTELKLNGHSENHCGEAEVAFAPGSSSVTLKQKTDRLFRLRFTLQDVAGNDKSGSCDVAFINHDDQHGAGQLAELAKANVCTCCVGSGCEACPPVR